MDKSSKFVWTENRGLAAKAFHQLCEGLFTSTPICFVTYTHLDKSGHYLCCFTDEKLYKDFLVNERYLETIAKRDFSKIPIGRFFLADIYQTDQEKAYRAYVKRNYGYDSSVCITNKNEQRVESFHFASKENQEYANFLLNNIEMIDAFFVENRQKIRDIMTTFNLSAIQLPNVNKKVAAQTQSYSPQQYIKLGVNIGLYHELLSLTRRDFDCLHLLIKGKRAKEIASELNLSIRTVQNYVERLKDKLHCKSSHEMIAKFSRVLK